MPRLITEEMAFEIERLFKLLDTTRKGSLPCSQVGTLFRALGYCPSENDIQTILEKHNKTLSQQFTKAEFCDMFEANTLPLLSVEGELDQLQYAFAFLDQRRVGKISKVDLVKSLTTQGEPLPNPEVEKLI